MRERRRAYESRTEAVWEMLHEGTRKARQAAAETMALVRSAMHIDYLGS